MALLLSLVLAVAPPTAEPDPPKPRQPLPQTQQDDAKAREAWRLGTEAYSAGNLEEAIRQFERAYRLSGRPGPLFSIGQAHRRLFERGQDLRDRHLAIKAFQEYLDKDPDGKRRVEAERYIAELMSDDELEGLGDPPATQLGLSSTVPGASVRLDGGPPHALPWTPDVDPGEHEVVVTAEGFHEYRVTVQVGEGFRLPVQAPLKPIDASLQVDAPEGSDLYIDGQRVARLPVTGPVAVSPGRHQVGIARPGRQLYYEDLEFGRAQRRRVRADLERTPKRKGAFAALAIGGTSIVASLTLMGLAFRAHSKARSIDEDRLAGSITTDEEQRMLDYRDQRNALRSASIATGVIGAAAVVTGVILYFTDRPPVAAKLKKPDRRTKRARSISVAPSGRGAMLRGRF